MVALFAILIFYMIDCFDLFTFYYLNNLKEDMEQFLVQSLMLDKFSVASVHFLLLEDLIVLILICLDGGFRKDSVIQVD